MKPNHISTITHQGTIATNSEAVQFGIDQSAMSHIMSLLTDLYSDRPGAVIREYSTNALDSHIAAGVDEPIEVELPTRWNASLIIRDHGIGMSKADIERIYGQYGTSTKRDTDAQNGMLGLGSKSALTYTSQFTLVGRKDNEQTTVLIARDENGVGVLKFIGEPVHTDDRNGVEITIPVTDTNEMVHKATEFFKYWEPGTVLVDGQQPENVFDREDALKIDDDIILLPVNGYHRDSRIVMAGVAYPFVLKGVVADHYNVIAKVPTGAVSFTPSREALMENSLTNDTVKTVQEFVNRHYKRMLQEQMDACETPIDAIRLYTTNGAMRTHKITYRGAQIKTNGQAKGWRWERGGWSSRASNINGGIRFDGLIDAALVVTGAPRPTATMKDKAAHYLQTVGSPKGSGTMGYGNQNIYFLEDNPGPGWLDDILIPYETIKAVKLPESEKPERSTQPKTKYRVWNRHAALVYIDDLPEDATLVWVGARSGMGDYQKMLLMDYIFDYKNETDAYNTLTKQNVVVVNVLKHKVAKFLKDHPDALTPDEFVKAEVADIEGRLSPLMVWRKNGAFDRPWINRSDLQESEDPDLIRLDEAMYAPLATQDSNLYNRWHLLVRLCSTFEVEAPTEPDTREYVDLYSTIVERYPWLFGYKNTPPVAWMLKAWYDHHRQEAMLDQMMVTNDYVIPVDLTKKKP